MNKSIASLILAVFILQQTGCGTGSKPVEKSADGMKEMGRDEPGKDREAAHGSLGHSHEPRHGGIVQSIGDFHLELVHDPKNGEISLYIMGNDEGIAHPIEAQPLTAQVRQDDDEDLLSVELNPIPLEGEGKGSASRFAGTEARMAGKKPFEAVFRIRIDGKVYRTVFQVVPGETRQAFVCPMDCESGKVYTERGKCPKCHMDLVHPKESHADHNPKHGGTFFMAPNRWHHLEGTMPNANEFRLYFYDNFTKPISAKPFAEGSFIEVGQLNAEKQEVGKPARISISANGDGSYLRSTIPDGIRFPMSITARIRFEGRDKPELFNFTFESASGEGKHDH